MQRQRCGSVVLDKRISRWNFFYWENGKRRSKVIGTLSQYKTKATAWRAAKEMRHALENNHPVTARGSSARTLRELIEAYRWEKMPKRSDTRKGYESWIKVHILPRWGESRIPELQARPVQMWLDSLNLAPKSKVHVRGIISALWNFAMWRQDIPMQVNPISLVTISRATKRVRQPRVLTVEQFRSLVSYLHEPFATMALTCLCFGLRISECLALKWSDIDWLNGVLRVERGIVAQKVDSTKTEQSQRSLAIATEMLERLKLWKQVSEFSTDDDWIFASPQRLGRLPYSYTGVSRILREAAQRAGIGHLTTHAFRHTCRTWLDSKGTPVGIQKRLLRHSSIVTTMDRYGDALTNDMREAHCKIVNLALSPIANGR
ncbi:MAG TPA: site-specific integrase [Candidatus Sulfotelmatobacter sp.]|nr:site-specific integrase [Candidatus Sulfotelmatobacter sp.]